jgi:hypothetical protein
MSGGELYTKATSSPKKESLMLIGYEEQSHCGFGSKEKISLLPGIEVLPPASC